MQADPETVNWETALAELLGELSDVQQELLEILAAKRDCMAASDLQGMAALQPREERLCLRLQACHQRRSDFLRQAAARGLPSRSLGQLASSLPGAGREDLKKQLRDASARMRLLQHQSLTNWVLAQRTMLHLSQLLEIIATGGRLQPTYGRGGSPEPRGSLVNREV